MPGRLFGAVLMLLLASAAAEAGPPAVPFYPYCSKGFPSFDVGCCPDDYCKKPLPCVAHPWCATCDDYCKKPLPCVGHNWCGLCDDYCKKPGPIPISACVPPWYKCYPACATAK